MSGAPNSQPFFRANSKVQRRTSKVTPMGPLERTTQKFEKLEQPFASQLSAVPPDSPSLVPYSDLNAKEDDIRDGLGPTSSGLVSVRRSSDLISKGRTSLPRTTAVLPAEVTQLTLKVIIVLVFKQFVEID